MPREVGVEGVAERAVVDPHVVAPAALEPRLDDLAGAGGEHRRAERAESEVERPVPVVAAAEPRSGTCSRPRQVAAAEGACAAAATRVRRTG